MKDIANTKTKSEKIFIDANDEILDVIDQIIETQSNKVLLILPKHSLIGSSTINLKLLSRKLIETEKAVILITPSELVINKAHEAGLIAKTKVEDIDQANWKEAFELIITLAETIETNKAKLINARKEKHLSADNFSAEEADIHEMPEIENELDNMPQPVIAKPEPKVITLKNFIFLPGADIQQASYQNQPIDTLSSSIKDPVKKKVAEQNIITQTQPAAHVSSGIIGHDITSERNKVISNFKPKKHNSKSFPKLFSKKLLILLILIFPALLIYRSYAERMEVVLEVESKSIELSQEVTGTTQLKEVDLTTKRIPVTQIVKTKSMSDSAPATGEGLKGEKATGVMDFFNKTQQEVILPAGTVVITINKNLTFLLNSEAHIPPAVSDITPSKLESIPIIAAEPGENYNISDTDVKITGYNPNSQLSGRIFRAVKGGTSQKVKIVTQQDVDKLKQTLTATITSLLAQEVEKSLQSDDIKLEKSQKITEKRFEVIPAAGQEADEFSITALELEMTALKINQDDLDKLADSLIVEQYNIPEGEEIESKQSATFENMQLGENGEIKFMIRKQGNVSANINEAQIKAAIENQSINDIGTRLGEFKEIKNYQINYSPSFLPAFLQRVPANKSKLILRIENKK